MRRFAFFTLSALFCFTTAAADEMSFPVLEPVHVPGAPVLGQPFLVMAGNKPVQTGKHGLAAPALWDWDGDGRRDLLVGEFETNSGELFPMREDGSTIRVYRNTGTAAEPRFAEQFEWARDTEGGIMEVPQWCCIGFTPMFYDLDDDGHKDMITGQYHPGEITWFRGSPEGFLPGRPLPQQGDPAAAANPQFDAERVEFDPDFQPYPGEPGDIGTFDYWVYSSATFGDLDDDGDFDLIVGGSGGLRVSENIGDPGNPSFGVRKLLLDVNGQPLQTRSHTEFETQLVHHGYRLPPSGDGKPNPLAVDWDQDGVLDLLVTDSYRTPNSRAVSFFRGVRTPAGHRFEPGIDLLPAEGGAKAIPGSGQRVYVDDWNGDGVNDLIIGASVATVNGGEFSDELSWEWEAVNKVESAGKDPGLYPPRPRPTAESQRALYEEIVASQTAKGITMEMPGDDELARMAEQQLPYWEEHVGRLYREGKAHWLTMRHQGRVYVLLGSKADGPSAVTAGNTPSPSEEGLSGDEPGAPAQDAGGNEASPVTLRVDPLTVLERESVAGINVRLDMDDGWYIYAFTGRNDAQGMMETRVAFSVPDGLEAAGGARLPPFGFKGSFDIHTGKGVTWTQPVKAAAGAFAGLYEVSADVTYQTCKDDLCLLPRTETVTARVLLQ